MTSTISWRGQYFNVQASNRFEMKSHDQGEDVTYQLHRSWDHPSVGYNFIPCQEVEQKEGTISMRKLGQWIMNGIEELQFDHAQIFRF